MDFEYPRISFNRNSGDYLLEFKLPKEYEQWKKTILPTLHHEGMERLAKFVFEEYGLPYSPSYPRFRWNEEGELDHMALGVQCACVSLHDSLDGKMYTSHNLCNPSMALAALKILSTFYNCIITDANSKDVKSGR
ncbi:MAG: hypothetical protein V1839_03650 [archaeon]